MQQNIDECIVDRCGEEAVAEGNLCASHYHDSIVEQEVEHGEERSELDY